MKIKDGGENVLQYSSRDVTSLKHVLVDDKVRLGLPKLEK